MQFAGKKIGIAAPASMLGNSAVLRELEKMVISGAELFIIITGKPEFKWEQRDAGSEQPGPRPLLDLLVIISGFAGAIDRLAQCSAGDYPDTPLVMLLLPSPGEKPSLAQLSSLVQKKGVFFVPFGPLNRNRNKEEKHPLICSRIDLLGEACAAALEGCQLCPLIWDNHNFPH